MLPAFMGIALFTRPRQLNDMEAPVRYADRLRQLIFRRRPVTGRRLVIIGKPCLALQLPFRQPRRRQPLTQPDT